METTSRLKVLALSGAAAALLAIAVIALLSHRSKVQAPALAANHEAREEAGDAFVAPPPPSPPAIPSEPPVTVRPESDAARAFVEKNAIEPRAWQGLRMMNDNWVALLRKTRSDGKEAEKLPLANVAAQHELFIQQTLKTPARIDAYHAWVEGLATPPVTVQGQDGKLYSAKEYK